MKVQARISAAAKIVKQLHDDDRSKLGGAQSGELPGLPEFTFIKLACPVEGCDTQVLKIHYDERNPDRFPIHPDRMLRVVN